jgi:hypothetical protein
MSTFSISDRGLIIKRSYTAPALDDTTARRRAVSRVLELLHPLVRPLALEITLGAMDPETFGVTPTTSRRLVSRVIPAGVACHSALAEPGELTVVDSLTPGVVMRALTPGEPGWDFCTISALVTAARVHTSELRIDRMPSLGVPSLEIDGAPWIVGPLDVAGSRLLPPISLRWHQEWGDLLFTMEALWSLWWETGSAEHAALRAAEQALDAAGFVAAA